MNPKNILIVGSANKDCDTDKIRKASEFSRVLTKEIISAGHSVAVLAMGEPVKTEQDQPVPLVFDWEVLRAVDECLMRTGDNGGRPLASVFMRDDAMQNKISDENATLIRKLQSNNAIEVRHIEADLYSGGEYRDWQTDFCHGMVAIGGGKGTYQVGDKMLKAGRPVMPMDIELGAYSEDGKGAVQLLSEMKSDDRTFLPRNYQLVSSKLYALSLENPYWPTQRVAYTVAAILSDELDGEDDPNPRRRFRRARALLGKLLPTAQGTYYGVKSAEALRDLFQAD